MTEDVHLIYRRGGIALFWLVSAAFVGFLTLGDIILLVTVEGSRNFDTLTDLLLHSVTFVLGIVLFFRATRIPVCGLSNGKLLLPNLFTEKDLSPMNPDSIRAVRFPTGSRVEIIDKAGQVTVLSLFGISKADRELLLQHLRDLKADPTPNVATGVE